VKIKLSVKDKEYSVLCRKMFLALPPR